MINNIIPNVDSMNKLSPNLTTVYSNPPPAGYMSELIDPGPLSDLDRRKKAATTPTLSPKECYTKYVYPNWSGASVKGCPCYPNWLYYCSTGCQNIFTSGK